MSTIPFKVVARDGVPFVVKMEGADLLAPIVERAESAATGAEGAAARAQNSLAFDSYADALAATGKVAGDRFEVAAADTGTHASVTGDVGAEGGQTPNSGVFEWDGDELVRKLPLDSVLAAAIVAAIPAMLADLQSKMTEWVRRDEFGNLALLDADFEGGRFYYDGTVYLDEDDWLTAIGNYTKYGARNATLGPNAASGAAELATGDFDDSGDTAAWTAGSGTTIAYVSGPPGAIRISASGITAYAYRSFATVVGKAYLVEVTDATSGTSTGQVRIGTTETNGDIQTATNVTNDGTLRFTFIATATTTYITLSTLGNGLARDFARASVRLAAPFAGYSETEGTLVTDWDAAASLASNDYLAVLIDRAGTGSAFLQNSIQFAHSSADLTVASFLIRAGNAAQASMVPTTVFTERHNTLVGSWKVNDVAASTNGEFSTLTQDNSATMPASINRMHYGHNGSGTAIAGTLRRMTYFPRRVARISERVEWYARFPDAAHMLGDSFANSLLRDALRTAYGSGFLLSVDGVGGSTLEEQATRYARSPALWDRSLIIMDGSGDDIERTRMCLPQIVGMCGHQRWVYVEPSPADAIAGSGARATFDAALAVAVAFGGAANSDSAGNHYIPTLETLKAANDGSANDLADVANDIVPRSLRTDTIHENSDGSDVRAGAVKTWTDARTWFFVAHPS